MARYNRNVWDLQNAYSKKVNIDFDELRFAILQKSSSNELRNRRPSKDALFQHLRCAYQAGWVWGNTPMQQIPPPLELWEWNTSKRQSSA